MRWRSRLFALCVAAIAVLVGGCDPRCANAKAAADLALGNYVAAAERAGDILGATAAATTVRAIEGVQTGAAEAAEAQAGLDAQMEAAIERAEAVRAAVRDGAWAEAEAALGEGLETDIREWQEAGELTRAAIETCR